MAMSLDMRPSLLLLHEDFTLLNAELDDKQPQTAK
jgi:hypothetical protein